MKKIICILFSLAVAICACNKDNDDPNSSDAGGKNNNSGTLVISNKTAFSAKVSIDGIGTYALSAESSHTITNVPVGNYSITYEQLDNYEFAPKITETIVESVHNGATLNIAFPSCDATFILYNASNDPCTFKISKNGYGSERYVLNPFDTLRLHHIPILPSNEGSYTIHSVQNSGYTLWASENDWTKAPECGKEYSFRHWNSFDKSSSK